MTTVATNNTQPAGAKSDHWWNSRVMRRFRRNILAIIGLLLSVAFLLVAAFAPQLAPPTKSGNNCLRDLGNVESNIVYNPTTAAFWQMMFLPPGSCYQTSRLNFKPEPSPPLVALTTDSGSVTPLMGTANGYDIWYGLVWGTRTALQLSFVIVFANLLVGMIVGAVSGYFGGWVDDLIQRIIDIIFAFPGFVLIMVIAAVLGRSLENLMLAFIITGWAGYARLIRGDVLRVRNLEFVDGARALGANDFRIILRHIIPNVLTTITAVVVLDLGSIPLTAAALSFIGIGLPVGYTDWGQMISQARAWIQGPSGNPFGYWYVTFFPAFTIILFGLGWNLLGDALRDALDPREK
jgi:peptide/nickel transport system permease protein